MEHGLGQVDGAVGRWLDTYDGDVGRAFDECRQGDWLLRIAMALGVDRRVVVAAAADAAALAVQRTEHVDIRSARCVTTAMQWSREECGAADAWAAAFAASQTAREIGYERPLESEAALAAAAAGFACDPRADDHWYAQRAYASEAMDHAARAFGADRVVGAQRCLAVAKERITLGMLTAAVSRATGCLSRIIRA